ncbi:unnamed protein product [Rhizoctonia solani]|uniref:Protein kinase domain-containing protein n=1 Tax=Rhizoctonia solani TaxID=456999 RepID=A0A8H3C7A9_9AGAM|nr:unnamed protein product [Rhizoctonia solani]
MMELPCLRTLVMRQLQMRLCSSHRQELVLVSRHDGQQAPEILSGKSGHTKVADVYSLGMTILEVFTVKPPYSGINEYALPLHIAVNLRKPERPLDVIPENSVMGNVLWAILMSCWSHNPAQRPDAEDVQSLLRTVRDDKLVPILATSESEAAI